MLVESVLFVAAALLIAYFVLQFVNKKATYQGDSALYDLSVPDQIVLSNKNLAWSSRPCTLRFAIFIKAAPKTLSKVDCIDTTTSFKPSCVDYSYRPCECSGQECTTRCSGPGSGYMSTLLKIGDHLSFLTSGYTSQNDKPNVPALLKVRTGKDSTQHYMEAVPLPALPLQRWTVVTIVKEGRRFDVYYGALLVASKVCNYVPVAPQAHDFSAGVKGWKGQIGLFNVSPNASMKDDVIRDLDGLINRRGIPFYLDEFNFDFNINTPTCLFGNCNGLPKVKPMNPFAVYATSVS